MADPQPTAGYLDIYFDPVVLHRYRSGEKDKLANVCQVGALIRDASSKLSVIEGKPSQQTDIVVTRDVTSDGYRFMLGEHGVARIKGVENIDDLRKVNIDDLVNVVRVVTETAKEGEFIKQPTTLTLPSLYVDGKPMSLDVDTITAAGTEIVAETFSQNPDRLTEFLGLTGLGALPKPIDIPPSPHAR